MALSSPLTHLSIHLHPPMSPPVIARACCGVFALCLLVNCAGYKLGNVKPLEWENIHSVAVPTFKSETLEPRIATLIASATVDALQNDGTYRIESVDRADAILYGTITRIERIPLRFSRRNQLRSSELLVRMEVEYRFEEAGTGVTLTRGKVRGESKAFLDPNFQLTERQTMYDIGEEVGSELVLRLAEGWPGKFGGARSTTISDEETRINRLREQRRAEALGLDPAGAVILE
ncbi:hypothetical protein BH23VER1_BH23VER1_13010 [soil metagenome]